MNLAIHENPTFWTLWLLTVVVCIHQTVVSVRTPVGILGFVPVVCTMFGYLYVVQSAAIATTLGQRINHEYLAMGQLVALLSLIAILAGWHRGAGKIVLARPAPINLARGRMLWYCGVSAIAVGIVGQYYYQISLDIDKTTPSGYLYMLFHVAFPGIAICIFLISVSSEFRSSGNILFLMIISALFILPWVYTVRRGPVFSFLIVLVYGFYLARPRLVNRAVVLGGLLSACVIMLFFLIIRDYNPSGEGSWSARQLRRVDVTNVFLKKAYDEDDNEFLYSCCVIGTCYELDRYQWGTSYLSLAMHWIPRSWWPDKPTLATGWFDPPTPADVYEATGILPSNGSAYAGVGESFMDFGWTTPIFWFGLGWGFGRLYRKSLAQGLSTWVIVYIGMIAASHYLITQGFAAFFVPACIYVAIPLGIFAISGGRGILMSEPPRRKVVIEQGARTRTGETPGLKPALDTRSNQGFLVSRPRI